MGGGLSDKDGDPLSPQEAAKRLAKALDKVEASTTAGTATRSAGWWR